MLEPLYATVPPPNCILCHGQCHGPFAAQPHGLASSAGSPGGVRLLRFVFKLLRRRTGNEDRRPDHLYPPRDIRPRGPGCGGGSRRS